MFCIAPKNRSSKIIWTRLIAVLSVVKRGSRIFGSLAYGVRTVCSYVLNLLAFVWRCSARATHFQQQPCHKNQSHSHKKHPVQVEPCTLFYHIKSRIAPYIHIQIWYDQAVHFQRIFELLEGISPLQGGYHCANKHCNIGNEHSLCEIEI